LALGVAPAGRRAVVRALLGVASVGPAHASAFQSGQAYLLFYVRRAAVADH